jgi:ferrous iron transport protein A
MSDVLRPSAFKREGSEGATHGKICRVAPFFIGDRQEERNMTLDQLKPGDEARIKKLSVRDKLGQRLVDMGVYPGLTLKVVRNAPLEDPMEIHLDGYYVSLRHEEARCVEVELP